MSKSKFIKPKGDSAMKDCFIELNELYTAIKDMDRVCRSPSSQETKLEDVLFAVKNVNMSQYKDEYVDTIISSVRKAIVDLYTEKIAEINKSINLDTSVEDSVEVTRVAPKKELKIVKNEDNRGVI